MNLPSQLQAGSFVKLQKNTKNPLADSWKENQYKATDKELLEWEGNIGFICGSDNIRVIDIEGEEKINSRGQIEKNPYFKELTEKLDKLNTFTIETPSKGRHYFIRNTEEYSQAYWNLSIGKVHAGEYRAKDCYVGTVPSEGKNWKYKIVYDVPIKTATTNYITELMEINKLKREATTDNNEITDETKSGKEYKEVCRLQSKAIKETGKPLSFEEIDKEMQAFAKWINAHPQYKKKTYEKATAFILEATKEKPKDTVVRELPFLSSKEIMETPKEKGYIIKNMIRKNTVNQLLSPPANYKSLQALNMAISVANGKDYLGFKTKKQPVCYLDKENNRQIISDRVKKIFKGLKLRRKTYPLTFLLREGELDDTEFVENLANYIEKNKIGLIIFDTLVRFNSGDENSSKDMNKLYQAFIRLQKNTEIAVVFLHHTNRMGEFRGSSDLMGQVDTMFTIKKRGKDNGKFVIENTKNRRGEINDIHGEILFGEEAILFQVNPEEAIEEMKEKINKFSLTRGFICDLAQTLCPSSTHILKKAEILAIAASWNAKVCKDKKISNKQISNVLLDLKLKKVFLDGQKQGEYRLNYEKKDVFSQYIAYIGEGNATKE